MEKDAKKLAKLTLKMTELSKKVSSGDKSAISEATDVGTKVVELTDELHKKYSTQEDEDKFSALYLKVYGELNGTQSSAGENENKDGLKDDSGKDSSSDDLTNQTKEILKKYTFSKITSLTSLIVISFDDNNFTFRVLATNGTELSRANGSYQISPASDGSIAKIALDREGPVQKSPAYADNQGIDTEVFLLFNKELLLKKASQDLLSHFSAMDMMTMKDKVPEFFVVGTGAFPYGKILSPREKHCLHHPKLIVVDNKTNLQEKLRGR